MNKENINELLEYNNEYMEAQISEEIFGGDYTSAVELEYVKKENQRLQQELERYKNIVDELDNKLCSTWQLYYDHSRLTPFKCEDMLGLIEQIRNDIRELKGE